MGSSVFVYGTLCAPEVVLALLGRAPRKTAASVLGYKRQCIKQQVFPAIVPSSPPDILQGWVLSGLTSKEMHILDEYEDVDYHRTTIEAIYVGGTRVKCELYVWKEDRKAMLIESEWDYEGFRRKHLKAYLRMTKEFANECQAETTSS